MKRKLLFAAALVVGALSFNANAQTKGDIVTANGYAYKVVGDENLFTNGSFSDGVTGWTAGGYSAAAVAKDFIFTDEGGFDGGKYITTNGAAANAATTLTQSIQVERGKTYYFSVWTSGKAPTSGNVNYNALFKMENATKEQSVIKAFDWPQGNDKSTAEWTQTKYVFTAETDYVGVRMGWNTSTNFDGFTLIEVENLNTPALNVKGAIGGENMKDFYPLTTADYTIEVAGTAEQEINIKGAGLVYTPETTATVRFVRSNNVVYVYENGVFKQTINQGSAYPVINDTNVAKSEDQILKDADFADKTGDLIAANLYKLGSNWTAVASYGSGSGSVRVNAASGSGAKSGNILIWRGTGNDNYFSQKVDGIKPNTYYNIQVSQRAGSNAAADFNVGLGNAAGDYSIAASTVFLGNGQGACVRSINILTPETLPNEVYFTFKNTNPSTSDNSGSNDAVTQLDWVSLVERFSGIEGAESMMVLDGEAYAPVTKDLLNAEIYNANLKIQTVKNIGDGVFQIADGTKSALSTAINTAKGVAAKTDATEDEIAQAIANLKEAEVLKLNEPDEDALFNIVNITKSYAHTSKALTFISAKGADLTDNSTEMKWDAEPGKTFYPQAVQFVPVNADKNLYKLCYTRADGNTVYVGTGNGTGLSPDRSDRLRPTTEKEKALIVQVKAVADNVWKLYNTEEGANIGATDDNGFYTNNGTNADVLIQEAVKVSEPVTVNINAKKYGTLIVPFDTDAPANTTVYSVASVTGEALNLVEVNGGLKANVPYILYANSAVENVQLSGIGAAYADDTFEDGLLTGAYTAVDLPVKSYVLQTQDNKQAFYIVEKSFKSTPYRAFLTVVPEDDPTDPETKAVYYFDFSGDATAIETVPEVAEGAENAVIYNLAGQRVATPVKGGIYIVNGQKVLVK